METKRRINMCKILVLYKSKYGASKKYAKMLKEEFSCDVFEIGSYNFSGIKKYDLIVAIGGMYAGGVSVMKYIRKNIRLLEDRNIIIFAVGASPFHEKEFEAVKEHNLKNLPFEIPMFYGRGAYDETVMDFKDRTLCRMLKKSLSKKDPNTLEPWMKAFFEADGGSYDWTERSYLEPLIGYVKKYADSIKK
jgi:menaquinone-dependent protoporphyrinogen IX oxidase